MKDVVFAPCCECDAIGKAFGAYFGGTFEGYFLGGIVRMHWTQKRVAGAPCGPVWS